MEKTYDAIVLGLGAMGSATLWQLARRGARVLGLDRHSPPHDRGSSHGDTRITRLAIGEGAAYTPLALRSHELWREIERETGADLLTVTCGLVISGAGERAQCHVPGFFANTLEAARRHCPDAVFIFTSTNKVYGDRPNQLPLPRARPGGRSMPRTNMRTASPRPCNWRKTRGRLGQAARGHPHRGPGP